MICLHQVGAGQELVSAIHAAQALAFNAHKARQPRARADKHGLKAVVKQLVHRQRLADDHVGFDLHAQRAQVFHLPRHDSLGQAKLRNAVAEHPTRRVQRFKHRHLIPAPRQFARAGKPRGAGAHHRHAMAVGRGALRLLRMMRQMPVRRKALQPADGDRLKLHAQGALAFALRFLRAHAAAHGGQGGILRDHLIRIFIIARLDMGNEIRNLNIDRASLHAGAVFAVQAARGLLLGQRHGIAQRHLVKVVNARPSLLRGHGILFCFNRHFYASPAWVSRLHTCSRAARSKGAYMRLRAMASSKSTS